MEFKKLLTNKISFMIALFLIFGGVSVIASGIFVSEDGIQANFISEDGNPGITLNMNFKELVDNNYSLIVENGIIVNITNITSTNETNETVDTILNHATLSNNLVSYYDLDETSGLTATDSHGSNDGTTTGATLNQTGHINTAYDFEASENDYLSHTTAFNFERTNSWTFNQWMEFESDTSMRVIAKQDNISPWNGYRLAYIGGSNNFNINLYAASGGTKIDKNFNVGELSTGVFRMVTWTYDGSSTAAGNKLYVDGTEITDVTINTDNLASNIADTDKFYFGATDAGATFDGKIDEVGIWNRTLNSTEISDLYNSGNGLAYN